MPTAKLHENILNQMSIAIMVLDNSLNVIYANSAAEAFSKQSLHGLKKQPFLNLLNHSNMLYDKLHEAAEERFSYTDNDVDLVFKNGHHVTAALTVTPLTYEEKDHLLLEFKAVDQQKKISQEMQRHKQQSAARRLVRGLAHEIKNPLGGLRGAAQLLEKELRNPELKEFTSIIIEQADRLRNLVDRLLGPNRPPQREPNNIHELIEKIIRLIELEKPQGINCLRSYDPSIPDIFVDPDQFQQAILNISRNAVHALGGKGNIEFKTRTESQVTILGKRCRMCAVISIKDNGPGIPEAIKDTLFYPMVSGRETGSGLGLPIAQTLIEQNMGKIDVASWPGQTEFTIYLPIGDDL